MKKTTMLFCMILIVTPFLFGCQQSDKNNYDKNASTSISSDNHFADNSNNSEPLTEKLIREIDDAYAEESKLPESSTTIGMVTLADKYTEKWKQVADEYYDKLMNYDGIFSPNENYYSSDDFHTFVSNMKTNWEKYNQEQCENYVKSLQAVYGGGTIVGPIAANYKYELQKNWALQLVGLYQQLYTE